jgi:hypothetical protein
MCGSRTDAAHCQFAQQFGRPIGKATSQNAALDSSGSMMIWSNATTGPHVKTVVMSCIAIQGELLDHLGENRGRVRDGSAPRRGQADVKMPSLLELQLQYGHPAFQNFIPPRCQTRLGAAHRDRRPYAYAVVPAPIVLQHLHAGPHHVVAARQYEVSCIKIAEEPIGRRH